MSNNAHSEPHAEKPKPTVSNFDSLPSCSVPERLTIVGLRIPGLAEFVCRYSEIRIPEHLVPSAVKDTGLFRYATFGTDGWKKVFLAVTSEKFVDWESPMSYIRHCEGIGTSRLALIIFAATGKLPPAEILCAIRFLADVLIPGNYTMDGQEQQGSSMVPREVFMSFVGTWNAESRDPGQMVDAKDVMEALLDSLVFIRDNTGTIRWLAEKDAAIGEAGFMVLANTESNWSVPPMPHSSEMSYTEEQERAINGVLGCQRAVACLTGAGGTGKTTVLRRIVQGYNRAGLRVMAMAPTGAAVVRMRSQIGDLVANDLIGTVHRFIYTRKEEILEQLAMVDVVIIDEASMLDSRTFGKFLLKIGKTKNEGMDGPCNMPKFLFSGDYSQLPPVGTGEGFSDLIHLDVCPAFRLTKVMRTSDPNYLRFFDAIRQARWSDPRQAFNVVGAVKDTFAARIDELVEGLYADHGPEWWRDTAVVAFRNNIVDRINALCYGRLVGRKVTLPRIYRDDSTGVDKPEQLHWGATGCRVIFTSNDSELGVVNGDVGTVMGSETDPRNHSRILTIVMLDGGETVRIRENYSSIKLGWARTVHKAQGAEYKRVWYVHENWLETRRLVYTAVTRSREELNMLIVKPQQFMLKDDPLRMTAIKNGRDGWNCLHGMLVREFDTNAIVCTIDRKLTDRGEKPEDTQEPLDWDGFGVVGDDGDDLPF